MSEAVSEQVKIKNSTLGLVRGDVTLLEVDAFVFYAAHDLALGSGYGTMISIRGGPSVQKELDELGSLEATGVVVTGAGNLKAEYIIHAVGPRFNEEDLEGKLKTTMVNVLKAAEEKGVKRLAFPPMGTGFYMIPLDMCVRVMIDTIKSHLEGETSMEEVIICAMDSREYGPFEAKFASMNR